MLTSIIEENAHQTAPQGESSCLANLSASGAARCLMLDKQALVMRPGIGGWFSAQVIVEQGLKVAHLRYNLLLRTPLRVAGHDGAMHLFTVRIEAENVFVASNSFPKVAASAGTIAQATKRFD